MCGEEPEGQALNRQKCMLQARMIVHTGEYGQKEGKKGRRLCHLKTLRSFHISYSHETRLGGCRGLRSGPGRRLTNKTTQYVSPARWPASTTATSCL